MKLRFAGFYVLLALLLSAIPVATPAANGDSAPPPLIFGVQNTPGQELLRKQGLPLTEMRTGMYATHGPMAECFRDVWLKQLPLDSTGPYRLALQIEHTAKDIVAQAEQVWGGPPEAGTTVRLFLDLEFLTIGRTPYFDTTPIVTRYGETHTRGELDRQMMRWLLIRTDHHAKQKWPGVDVREAPYRTKPPINYIQARTATGEEPGTGVSLSFQQERWEPVTELLHECDTDWIHCYFTSTAKPGNKEYTKQQIISQVQWMLKQGIAMEEVVISTWLWRDWTPERSREFFEGAKEAIAYLNATIDAPLPEFVFGIWTDWNWLNSTLPEDKKLATRLDAAALGADWCAQRMREAWETQVLAVYRDVFDVPASTAAGRE